MRSKSRMRQRVCCVSMMRVGQVSSRFDNCDGGVVLAKAASSNITNATSYCKLPNITQLVQLIGIK